MSTYLTVVALIFAVMLGGIAIDRLCGRFAPRHPQLGPFRKRGGGCGCCAAKDGCQDPASCRG